MHQVLRDAAFLDDRSAVLQARFITYNHPHETFCMIEIQIAQGRNGAFQGQVLLPRPEWAASTTMVPLKGTHGCLAMLLTSLSGYAWTSCECASIKRVSDEGSAIISDMCSDPHCDRLAFTVYR
jgi:hypothetical protein